MTSAGTIMGMLSRLMRRVARRSGIRASASAASVPVTTDAAATVKPTMRLFSSAGQNELLASSFRYQSRVRPVSGRLVSAERLKLNSTTRNSGVAMKTTTASVKARHKSSAASRPITASAIAGAGRGRRAR